MRSSIWKIAALATFALWFAWLPDPPALGHGEEEILLFAYLAEEKNLLRISTAIVGGIILAMGAFITQQSRAEAREGAGSEYTGFKVMMPGLLVTCLGVAVLFTAAFILARADQDLARSSPGAYRDESHEKIRVRHPRAPLTASFPSISRRCEARPDPASPG